MYSTIFQITKCLGIKSVTVKVCNYDIPKYFVFTRLFKKRNKFDMGDLKAKTVTEKKG
jgi:hypothetical protein